MYELFSNTPNKWQKKYAAAGAADYFILIKNNWDNKDNILQSMAVTLLKHASHQS